MVFTVNNHIWHLEFCRPNSPNLRRSNNTLTLGVTDNNVKTVYLADSLNDYMRDKVLLHELSHVHAIEYNYRIPIEIEEVVCDFLSLYGRSVIYIADEILNKIMISVA